MNEKYNQKYSEDLFNRIERNKPASIGKLVSFLQPKYFANEIIINDSYGLKNNSKNQRIYISNHISNLDPLFVWLSFHRKNIEMPMIPSINALDQPLLKVIGLDFGKMGSYFLNGNISEKTRNLTDNGRDFFIFPEGEINYNGIPFKKFETGILKNIIYDVQKDFDIIPVGIKYDYRIEGNNPKNMENINKDKFLGMLKYYGLNSFYFGKRIVSNFFGSKMGRAEISFGKSKSLSELINQNSSRKIKVEKIKEYSLSEIVKLS